MSEVEPRWTRAQSFGWVALAYVVAIVAGFVTVQALHGTMGTVWVALIADLVATCVIFAFSRGLKNSSLYDAYWSVAPAFIAIYWLINPENEVHPVRAAVVAFLVCWWAARLTWNWARSWPGLHHEDWRYIEMRKKTGKGFFFADLMGIHVFPTFQVFAGMLGAWVAISQGTRPLGIFDALAFAFTALAIIIETVSDRQLVEFAKVKKPGEIINHGLWAYSRHPNYFGEVSFWWGLFFCGMAAQPETWWTIVGPLAITAMFMGVSIPWLDQRSAERRPGYAEHMKRVSGFLPWFPKS